MMRNSYIECAIYFTVAIALILALPVALTVLAFAIALLAFGALLYAVLDLIYVGAVQALTGLDNLGVWLMGKAISYGEQISIYIAGLHKRYFTDTD